MRLLKPEHPFSVRALRQVGVVCVVLLSVAPPQSGFYGYVSSLMLALLAVVGFLFVFDALYPPPEKKK